MHLPVLRLTAPLRSRPVPRPRLLGTACCALLAAAALPVNHGLAQDSRGEPVLSLGDYTARLTRLEGTTPAQWRVTWKGDAARTATVSWSTAEAGSTHVLHYDTVARDGDLAACTHRQACQRNGAYTLSSDDSEQGTAAAHYHHARLTGLKPGTTYFLTMVSDGVASREFHFTTAPADGRDFSLLNGGDSRSGHLNRCHMNRMMAGLMAGDPDLLGLAHGGDYIASGQHWRQWRLWLSQHELTTTEAGRLMPVVPARGNHDGGPLLAEIFDFEPAEPIAYPTRFGKNVALLTLEGPHHRLEAWLTELRPQTLWLLAQYHRPIYPAVKGPAGFQALYARQFERHHLDLALEADGHCIKRTVPIRDGRIDPTGVTYIGEGGLGVGQRTPVGNRWYLQEPGMSSRGSHVFRLDFSDQSLRIRCLLLGGEVHDDHTLRVRPEDQRGR